MKKKLTIEQKKHKAEYGKLWYKKNSDKIAEQHKIWRKKNKDKVRDRQLQRDFDINLQEYTEMWIQQDGVCKICRGNNLSGKSLAVDHNHKTGNIRGLLCSTCNRGIGNLKDDPNLLLKAYYYLKG